VVGADHPDRAIRLQNAAASEQPCTGERIIDFKGGELVPLVIDGIDQRLIGTVQRAAELEIIRRICKDRIDGVIRQGFQSGDAIAFDDGV